MEFGLFVVMIVCMVAMYWISDEKYKKHLDAAGDVCLHCFIFYFFIYGMPNIQLKIFGEKEIISNLTVVDTVCLQDRCRTLMNDNNYYLLEEPKLKGEVVVLQKTSREKGFFFSKEEKFEVIE